MSTIQQNVGMKKTKERTVIKSMSGANQLMHRPCRHISYLIFKPWLVYQRMALNVLSRSHRPTVEACSVESQSYTISH